METRALSRSQRISAQKLRLMADLIRNKTVIEALATLKFHTRFKSAGLVSKTLNSAVANAEHNLGLDREQLKISQIFVDQGPRLKRMAPRAKGRGNRIEKPTSHLTIVVSN